MRNKISHVVCIIVALLSCSIVINANKVPNYKVLHEWVEVEYDWEGMNENKDEWIANGSYIPENCILAGVKQWKSDIYVTIPRWYPGVPATLNKLITKGNQTLLQPYPSLDAQRIEITDSIKYVQDVEIDPKGRMWIIDNGYYDEVTAIWYSPKLLIYDLNTNSQIMEYLIPLELVPQESTFLNDIVVDIKNDFAYISNTAGNGGIFGFDLKSQAIRLWQDISTMAETNGNIYNISSQLYDLGYYPSDGIALSPDFSELFYCPLSGFTLYSLSTSLFRNFSTSDQHIAESVTTYGMKLSQSDGIAFDANGILYYGNIGSNSINYWDSSYPFTTSNQRTLLLNDTILQWPDTFGFDNQGNLLVMTNKLHLVVTGKMDFTGGSGNNFHLISIPIGANSYMYYSDSLSENSYSNDDLTSNTIPTSKPSIFLLISTIMIIITISIIESY